MISQLLITSKRSMTRSVSRTYSAVHLQEFHHRMIDHKLLGIIKNFILTIRKIRDKILSASQHTITHVYKGTSPTKIHRLVKFGKRHNSVYVTQISNICRCICMKMKQLEDDKQLFYISYGNFENNRPTVKVHSTISLYCTPFLCG